MANIMLRITTNWHNTKYLTQNKRAVFVTISKQTLENGVWVHRSLLRLKTKIILSS